LDPADFTARRDQRAKELRQGGDASTAKVVKGLKRPSVAAWAINVLVREKPGEIDRLNELGNQLREAQARLSGDELRRLSKERQRLTTALAGEARRLASSRGHALTDAAVRQVEETLTAALADPAAAAALGTGRLVNPLEHAGIGPVDLDGVIGGPAPAVAAALPAEPAAVADTELEGELATAAEELAQAEEDARVAGDEQRAAAAEADYAEGEVARVEADLARARDRAARARARAEEAAVEAARATDQVAAGRQRVEELRARLS
jgi:hypothetical protein